MRRGDPTYQRARRARGLEKRGQGNGVTRGGLVNAHVPGSWGNSTRGTMGCRRWGGGLEMAPSPVEGGEEVCPGEIVVLLSRGYGAAQEWGTL